MKTTQTKQILDYLKSGKSLTPLESLKLFGTLRLSARICELRNEGHPIVTKHVHTKTHKYVAQYSYGKSNS